LELPNRTWQNAGYAEIIYIAFALWFQKVNVPGWRRLVELIAGAPSGSEHCWRIWEEIQLRQGLETDLGDVLENGFSKFDAEIFAPRLSRRPLAARNKLFHDKDETSSRRTINNKDPVSDRNEALSQ
jgi:hypothetical protein